MHAPPSLGLVPRKDSHHWPVQPTHIEAKSDLWWKTTFGGRQPLVDDDCRWKTIVGGRRPLVEDDLWWKTTLSGRQLSVEDDLWWMMTFGGRQPSVEDHLQWILACFFFEQTNDLVDI